MDIKIVKSSRKTMAIQITKNGVLVRAPYGVSKRTIDAFIASHKKWIEDKILKLQEAERAREAITPLTEIELSGLINAAKDTIPPRVAYYAEKLGVDYKRITIRCQKTRWGSCSSAGNLNFNCLLMLAPCEVLDSVIVHELCHRRYMNHSKEFYDMLVGAFPEYKKWNKWLKDNGKYLIYRIQ